MQNHLVKIIQRGFICLVEQHKLYPPFVSTPLCCFIVCSVKELCCEITINFEFHFFNSIQQLQKETQGRVRGQYVKSHFGTQTGCDWLGGSEWQSHSLLFRLQKYCLFHLFQSPHSLRSLDCRPQAMRTSPLPLLAHW